jgi:hypothetical protein
MSVLTHTSPLGRGGIDHSEQRGCHEALYGAILSPEVLVV